MQNRSVPVNTVLPHLAYRDVGEAIDWLTRTFGLTEHYRHGEPAGPISGAQMRLGDAVIMLKRASGDFSSPANVGARTQSLTIFVDDVHEHYARTQSAGATITEELHETCYGERQYGAADVDGHRWLFSQHVRDLSPDEWGAIIAR